MNKVVRKDPDPLGSQQKCKGRNQVGGEREMKGLRGVFPLAV